MSDKIIEWSIYGAVMAAVGTFALCMFMVATSSGKIDYCRVRYNNDSQIHPPVYVVEGHRSWRPDVNVAIAVTAEEADTKLKTLCPQ